ncbi:MAG: TIR domain-containing protein [Thiotrichales bacterium]
MSEKPRVFVASSSEQIGTAVAIADGLNASPHFVAQAWRESVFAFSKSYIESLEAELDRADFAIVVLTADDVARVRTQDANLPRDNVIFELGLFIGRLGRERCFFFVDSDSDTRIASDLSGVKCVGFHHGATGDWRRPDLATQIAAVGIQMREVGIRYKPAPGVRDEQQALWRFTRRFAGHWWERMRPGDDDASALSYLTVTLDPVTNTPRIDGKAYGKVGEPLADWHTVATGVQLGARPKVIYRWEGEQDAARGETYGGGGVITLDDDRLVSGSGYFFDTNFAQIRAGAVTRVKHFALFRCDPVDIETLREPWSEAAQTLIQARLGGLRGR